MILTACRDHWPGSPRRNSAREAVAGVTLLAIAVPLNIGYAQIAGLPPTAGLYALVVPAIVYALLVSSRQVVASPDAAAAALVASSIGGLAVSGSTDYLTMAFAQAIICGALFALAGVFRLGFLSKPILVGFVGGLALDILISQIAKMLGVSIDSGGEFVDKVTGLVTGPPTANGWSMLMMVTMAEGLLVARSYGEKRGYTTSPNRDLFAFGAANAAAGATGGFAVGSSTSRTAAMDQTGSRTQLPSLVAAVGTLLLLLFGTGLLEHIPSPAIGAIVGVAILPLLGIRDFRLLWRHDRSEFVVGAVCFLATLFIGAIPGILIAFVLALINLARRASSPAIDVLAADGEPGSSLLDPAPAGTPTTPGVLIIRMAAPLFFANGSVFSDAVKHAVSITPAVRHVVFDLETVTDVDVTGAEALDTLRRWLDGNTVTLGYSRPRRQIVARMRALDLISTETFCPSNRAAITELSASTAAD